MERKLFEEVKLGELVAFITGPGQTKSDCVGAVIAKTEDRWGTHLVVEIEESPERRIEMVTNFTEVGIGAYRLGKVKA
jgi:hypothetical protein